MLGIRTMTVDDVPFFNEVRNLSLDYLHNPLQFSVQDSLQWFTSTSPRFFVLEVDGTATGYFRTSNWTPTSAYVGLDIHPRARGLGHARPAYALFLRMLRDDLGLTHVQLEVLEANHRARHIYARLGFQIVSTLEGSIKMELALDRIKFTGPCKNATSFHRDRRPHQGPEAL